MSSNSNSLENEPASNIPLTRVSGRTWKVPKKPFNRDSFLKFGKGSWDEKMKQKEKVKEVKALEKKLKDEVLERKKLRGQRLAEKRIKKEARLKEEKLRASMTRKQYDRLQRRQARKIKIANRKAEMHAET